MGAVRSPPASAWARVGVFCRRRTEHRLLYEVQECQPQLGGGAPALSRQHGLGLPAAFESRQAYGSPPGSLPGSPPSLCVVLPRVPSRVQRSPLCPRTWFVHGLWNLWRAAPTLAAAGALRGYGGPLRLSSSSGWQAVVQSGLSHASRGRSVHPHLNEQL
jgi:hypothetical protein